MGRYSWLRLGSLRMMSSACEPAVSISIPRSGSLCPSEARTHLLDDGQDPGLCVVVAVGSDAQIDLVGVLVTAERCHEPKERVLGRLRDHIRGEACRRHGGDVLRQLGETGLRRECGRGRRARTGMRWCGHTASSRYVSSVGPPATRCTLTPQETIRRAWDWKHEEWTNDALAVAATRNQEKSPFRASGLPTIRASAPHHVRRRPSFQRAEAAPGSARS
jgi:hypothetical protein